MTEGDLAGASGDLTGTRGCADIQVNNHCNHCMLCDWVSGCVHANMVHASVSLCRGENGRHKGNTEGTLELHSRVLQQAFAVFNLPELSTAVVRSVADKGLGDSRPVFPHRRMQYISPFATFHSSGGVSAVLYRVEEDEDCQARSRRCTFRLSARCYSTPHLIRTQCKWSNIAGTTVVYQSDMHVGRQIGGPT